MMEVACYCTLLLLSPGFDFPRFCHPGSAILHVWRFFTLFLMNYGQSYSDNLIRHSFQEILQMFETCYGGGGLDQTNPFDASVHKLRELGSTFVATKQAWCPRSAPQQFTRVECHPLCRFHESQDYRDSTTLQQLIETKKHFKPQKVTTWYSNVRIL